MDYPELYRRASRLRNHDVRREPLVRVAPCKAAQTRNCATTAAPPLSPGQAGTAA
jgi:hypothetical protein